MDEKEKIVKNNSVKTDRKNTTATKTRQSSQEVATKKAPSKKGTRKKRNTKKTTEQVVLVVPHKENKSQDKQTDLLLVLDHHEQEIAQVDDKKTNFTDEIIELDDNSSINNSDDVKEVTNVDIDNSTTEEKDEISEQSLQEKEELKTNSDDVIEKDDDSSINNSDDVKEVTNVDIDNSTTEEKDDISEQSLQEKDDTNSTDNNDKLPESSIHDETKEKCDSDDAESIETVVSKPLDNEEIDDNANNKKIKRKSKKSSMTSIIIAAIIYLCIFAGLIVGIGVLYLGKQMIDSSPELKTTDFVSLESTKIYDGNDILLDEIGAFLRENISYDDIPQSVIDAFVSIEDSRYFEHKGFDVPRFTKAILENLKTMSFGQGGSTFTMQLVKNTYFTVDSIDKSTVAEKKIDRKVQEIYLATKLEQELSKKEIIELYLNKLNFGGNIRGIQKASLFYFGKQVNELTLSEGALLAGIINRPNAYNPYNFLDYATKRRNTVLDMMVYHGYITADEAELAKAVKVEDCLVGEEKTYISDSKYQSYVDAVIEEARDLTGKDPALAGMKIYTHCNRDVQVVIDNIQNSKTDIVFPDELMQIALISINNQTGAIIGIGGGRNYDGGARLLNRATSQFKQPGSSVKPFLSYALAFEHLYWSNQHVLTDRPMTYRGASKVMKNFDGKYRGDVLISQAFAQSLNIPAIQTLQDVIDAVGKDAVADYLNSIGFTRVNRKNFDISYAIGGTTFETTVKEMAGAHAMIINKGVYNKPHTIRKIVLSDGTEIYPNDLNKPVLSTGSAYLASQLMRFAVEGPYFNYMQILKRNYPVYAKSGTTDWGSDGLRFNIPKGAAKDKWMLSSSTTFTNGVWLGYDKGIKNKQTYFTAYKSSLNLPGKINKLLMDTVEKTIDYTPPAVEKPDDIENITYVLGSWPYATPQEWVGQSVTAEIRKGHPALTSIDASTPKDVGVALSDLTVSYAEDGNLHVVWHASGTCSDGIKDLTLNDGRNYVPASGACIFDAVSLSGAFSYYGTVYVNEVAVANITGSRGVYHGIPANLDGSVKVCGGYSYNNTQSNTVCSYLGY